MLGCDQGAQKRDLGRPENGSGSFVDELALAAFSFGMRVVKQDGIDHQKSQALRFGKETLNRKHQAPTVSPPRNLPEALRVALVELALFAHIGNLLACRDAKARR